MFCHDIVFLQKLVFGEYVMLNVVFYAKIGSKNAKNFIFGELEKFLAKFLAK